MLNRILTINLEYKPLKTKNMKHTIKDWFTELPKEVKEKALYYLNDDYDDYEVESLSGALMSGIAWRTDDNYQYWRDVYLAITKGEYFINEFNQSLMFN